MPREKTKCGATKEIVLTAQKTTEDLLEMSVFQNAQCEYLLNSVSPK